MRQVPKFHEVIVPAVVSSAGAAMLKVRLPGMAKTAESVPDPLKVIICWLAVLRSYSAVTSILKYFIVSVGPKVRDAG